MKELFKLNIDESDDNDFMSIVNRLITWSATTNDFQTATITKVKNWFDHKWLNYSGKEVVRFESGGLVNNDLALKARWKEQITFPPFNPNRVLSSKTYPLKRAVNNRDLKPIHTWQVSYVNLQNRVALISENTLYAWFSSNSKINNKGSLMIYELENNAVHTWYCQIEKHENWRIGKTKNVSREELNKMMT